MGFRKILLAALFAISSAAVAEDVRILPLRGPMGTAKIAPGDASSTAYRMDFPGQAAICFQNITATDVFISSASTIGANGWGLLTAGEAICADLTSGTTLYFYGAAAGADVRAIMAR